MLKKEVLRKPTRIIFDLRVIRYMNNAQELMEQIEELVLKIKNSKIDGFDALGAVEFK